MKSFFGWWGFSETSHSIVNCDISYTCSSRDQLKPIKRFMQRSLQKVTTLTVQDTNSTVVVIWYLCCISNYLLYKVGKGSSQNRIGCYGPVYSFAKLLFAKRSEKVNLPNVLPTKLSRYTVCIQQFKATVIGDHCTICYYSQCICKPFWGFTTFRSMKYWPIIFHD